jgi:hypothetical protein
LGRILYFKMASHDGRLKERSVALPVYDLALILSLVMLPGIFVAILNRRFLAAFGFGAALVGAWIVALIVGVLSKVSPQTRIKWWFKVNRSD